MTDTRQKKDWSLLKPGWDPQRLDQYTINFLSAHLMLNTYDRFIDFNLVDHLRIPDDEIVTFLIDPIPLVCRHYQAPSATIERWLEAEGYVCCSAKTKKGHRCKKLVYPNLGQISDPIAWQAACDRGDYCQTHGGTDA